MLFATGMVAQVCAGRRSAAAESQQSLEQRPECRSGTRGRAAPASTCDGCGEAEPADSLLLCDGCAERQEPDMRGCFLAGVYSPRTPRLRVLYVVNARVIDCTDSIKRTSQKETFVCSGGYQPVRPNHYRGAWVSACPDSEHHRASAAFCPRLSMGLVQRMLKLVPASDHIICIFLTFNKGQL